MFQFQRERASTITGLLSALLVVIIVLIIAPIVILVTVIDKEMGNIVASQGIVHLYIDHPMEKAKVLNFLPSCFHDDLQDATTNEHFYVEHAIGDHIASSKPNVEVHHQSEQSSQPQVPISKSHIASSNPIITSTTFVPSEQYQVFDANPPKTLE
ncbi:hypothetical protein JHK82_048048 [Glycine max]|nr:hypothetical protein JHK82_048048 [Glycine max]